MSIKVSSERDNATTMHDLKKLSDKRVQVSSFRQDSDLSSLDIDVLVEDWPDIVFRYYEDTDDLAVYFVKASPGVIDYCEDTSDDILVSYDSNDKIVSVDIDGISKILQCHMFDVREEVDGKPPLMLNSIYYRDSDTLKVYFIDFIPSASTVCKKTDIEDIEIEVDDTGRIVCILFCNANEKIAKLITEEERKSLALKCEEETKELEKWSNRIVRVYNGKF
ncbi:uncharacterized protein OCT59_021832 [Rhizophagus irregularis]|uniref:Uncharacterized protein n=2 Tax=Rhizophagus irregularis TaxID=588596 RepID=U9UNX6_RHIID|nr:hypothetical protein GLOIN_2v1731410 [Rhizophagus irregularis DAOM 181602=DAOM 197198]POG58372.1 hypothetical protein GLOIN_2v1731410 [Rhizophagus irregularis DAOM 181602=DAOM 197198]UZO28300.1 hypothetical protein OCT59_021832 [Rhizophagus irregularis]|eukprot:XP_025165238.1 hypothetical protein GLOIN_2v1731410 [Rhizophagus irregularis DAOM 181602=DAOM 197198]